MQVLRWRVLSAAVGVPLLVAVAVVGRVYLLALVMAVALIAANELITKCRAAGIVASGAIVYPVALLLPVLTYAWTEPPLAAAIQGPHALSGGELALALLATMFYLAGGALMVGLLHYHRDQRVAVVRDVGATVLAGLYTAVPWSFVGLLRTYPFTDPVCLPPLRLEIGARLLLFTLLVTWATDITAYFVGQARGRRQLTPASPNKTFEGAVGGLVGAVAVGMGTGLALGLPLSFAWTASPLLGLTGQLGDLAKSILKRDLGTKDFGSFIPGHGGALDRFDSLMFNAPVAFFCALALLRG